MQLAALKASLHEEQSTAAAAAATANAETQAAKAAAAEKDRELLELKDQLRGADGELCLACTSYGVALLICHAVTVVSVQVWRARRQRARCDSTKRTRRCRRGWTSWRPGSAGVQGADPTQKLGLSS